jgi:LCP family protein required for cell wall assembly
MFAEPDSTELLEIPPDAPPKQKSRRGRRARRIVLITLVVLALLGGGGLLAGGLYYRSVEGSIERVDAFKDVPTESRPEKVADDAKNILILGSDSRDPENATGGRSDTIILAHLPKGRGSAQLISIPRDLWVPVPKSKDGQHGGRDAKINAAFAWGGIPLTVQTVEKYTGVRIDHVSIIDFAGFQEIVDALDGVEIDVEQSFTSIHKPHRKFTKGPQTLDGAAALDYARERYAFRDGDFARMRHQQQLIKAVLDKAASGGLLTNPVRLNSFLRATADAVSVDETMSIFDTASELRHLRSGNLTFLTSPNKGSGRVGSESVVLDDPQKAKALYSAVRRDSVQDVLNAAK